MMQQAVEAAAVICILVLMVLVITSSGPRAARRAAKIAARAAAEAAEPKYQIVSLRTGEVLQEVSGTYPAQSAQEDWHYLWLAGKGPRTEIKPKPTGLPDSRDTLDALILEVVPEAQRDASRAALQAVIKAQVPPEDLLWLASEGRR